jgi:hypothetical protein
MKTQILLAGMFLLTIGLSAQEVISTQGDSYSNTNNTLDYTIGEPVIETLSNSNNDLTQGFHQTLLTIVGIEDLDVNFLVNIFPNPTSEIVNLDIEKYEGVTFHLFNVEGKLLTESELTEKKTTVRVADYPKGTYLLTLTHVENKKIKTYKIIKK